MCGRVVGSEFDARELTRGLGESYATRSIMLKRFPCHITAHTSVQAILDLRAQYRYGAATPAIRARSMKARCGMNRSARSPNT